MTLNFKMRSHATRRKVEVIEVYDGDELIATIIPGADGEPSLSRSIAIFSKYMSRGHEVIVFTKEPVAPEIK